MATSFADLSDFGDSGGESLGDGLTSGLGYSGDSLEDIETPFSGSALTLDPSVGTDVSIFDSPTGYDALNLAGNSDAAPNPLDDIVPESISDMQIGGTNGAGVADSTALHPADVSPVDDTFLLTSAVSKYGSVFASLFQKGAAPTVPTVHAPLPNQNPNRRRVGGVVTSNFVVVVLVIVAIALIVLAMGE